VTKVTGPVNVELQRSKRVHPFCTHIHKIKPFEAEAIPISWLQDAMGDPSQIGTDVDVSLECTSDECTAPVGDMVRIQQGLPGYHNPQDSDGACTPVMGRLPVHPQSTFILLDHDDPSVVPVDIQRASYLGYHC